MLNVSELKLFSLYFQKDLGIDFRLNNTGN